MIVGEVGFEIGEDGIGVTNPVASSHRPWRSLTALVDGGTLRLIKTVIRNQSVLIVKSAFAEADQQAIVELAHRKLANPVAPSAGEGVTVRPPTPE